MTQSQIKALETILTKVEALQNRCAQPFETDRLGKAKDELLRLHREVTR